MTEEDIGHHLFFVSTINRMGLYDICVVDDPCPVARRQCPLLCPRRKNEEREKTRRGAGCRKDCIEKTLVSELIYIHHNI